MEEQKNNKEFCLTKLTEKNILFVQEYLIDYDGKNAAIRAGYEVPGAASTACRLLQQTLIINEIQKQKEIDAVRYEIRKEVIVRELFDIITKSKAKGDINNLLKGLDMLNKMAGNYSQTITSINVEIPLFPDMD